MMDRDQSARLLFDYLRDILYAESPQAPDMAEFSPAMHDLGLGLQYLQQAVEEMKEYSGALARGNLSVEPPPRENFLCENLKNIHANLNHLTWQAQQVAKGDYSQSVTYMGQFSEAFNRMTDQLREREDVLVLEAHQDALTGIGNRHFLREKLEAALESGEGFLFCYCDLDHLKYVNDRFGHAEGDNYIRRFVDTVQGNIRRGDIFARIGGDEFCLLLRRSGGLSLRLQLRHSGDPRGPRPYGCRRPSPRGRRPNVQPEGGPPPGLYAGAVSGVNKKSRFFPKRRESAFL